MNDDKKSEKCEHCEALEETLLQVYSWNGNHVCLEIQDYCRECGNAWGEPYLRTYKRSNFEGDKD